ncbi:MAG: hypothetical protein JO046_03885, partial [Solirubrobacterales bacterium]|nr:hypothetical protein [Solirubrobacterales bacterium]
MPELDERQLLVELQSLGVKVQDDSASADQRRRGSSSGRRGGAGPSDALFMWVRGLPLTVPWQAGFVDRSPYTVHLSKDGAATLFRGENLVGPVKLPRRPRIYDMETVDG